MKSTLALKNKRVLVLGLGLLGGGLATVKFLLAQKAKVTITDLKSKKELAPILAQLKNKKITCILGRHRLQDIKENEIIIKNPSVPKDSSYLLAAKKYGKFIENDASLFFRFCPHPVIGVTGSKGKSTTVFLIKKFFEHAGKKPVLVGHDQTAVLSQLKLIGKNQPIIFELSSWRLERLSAIKKSPKIAVITNVLRDHLNKYKNFSAYLADKKNIFRFQHKNDYVILNRDNAICRQLGQEVVSRRFWFSKKYFAAENGICCQGSKIIFRHHGRRMIIVDLKNHQWPNHIFLENILPAILVAKLGKISNQNIVATLDHLPKGLNGRLEKIATVRGIIFINDTCATVPEATIKALETISPPLVLIAGGEDKNLDYSAFIRLLPSKAKSIHFIDGTATRKMIRQLGQKKLNYTLSPTLAKAFRHAVRIATLGDTVLLSPAAASFGKYFVNEFDRGKQFNQLVKSLKK